MPKNYCMPEDQKKINKAKALAKYRENIKNDEIFCDVCCCLVKKISISQHNKGKKHIDKSKNVVKNILDFIKSTTEKIEKGNNIKECITDLFYYIKNEYFDADENEKVLDEDFKHDAKTQEEIAFCSQPVGSMSYDIEILIEEEVHDHKLYDSVKEQRDKIDINSINAKQKLLDIWRRIKSTEEKPIPAIVANPLPPKHIKTIEEPKVVKKVEIKEQLLDEDFPPYSRFIKVSNYAKLKCLENIVYNHQHIFEESSDLNVVAETIENENEDDYDEVYKRITILKSDYDDNMGEEEEEDF